MCISSNCTLHAIPYHVSLNRSVLIGVRRIGGIYHFADGNVVGSYAPWTSASQASECVTMVPAATWTKGLSCDFGEYYREYACQADQFG